MCAPLILVELLSKCVWLWLRCLSSYSEERLHIPSDKSGSSFKVCSNLKVHGDHWFSPFFPFLSQELIAEAQTKHSFFKKQET